MHYNPVKTDMEEKRFSDLGRVGAISALYEGTPYKAFAQAHFAPDGLAATASRLFLEGTDFNLIYFPLKHLGYRSVTAVSGDLYASLAHPVQLSLTLGVSAKLDFPQIKELWSGIVTAAKEHGYKDVLLDLIPSRNGLSIAISAAGAIANLTAARRPKAKSKDLLCISGPLGAAYLGMSLLEKKTGEFEQGGPQPDLEAYKMIIGDYLKPEINPSVLGQLEEQEIIPSAACLVDRGLADAVKRLSRDCSLGVKVYADKIPFEGNSFELGKKLDIDPISAAFNGGEDYRLLLAVPILKLDSFRHNFQTFDIIGHLAQPEAGAVMVTPEGAELPIYSQGWAEED